MTSINADNGEVSSGGEAGSTNTADSVREAIAASAQGPVPVAFYRRNSAIAMSQAEAEADPDNAMVPFNGTRGSLRALMTAGLIERGEDGNYFDPRGGASQTPAKKPAAPQKNALHIHREGMDEPEVDQGEEAAPDAVDELADFKMSPEGSEAVNAIQEINEAAPEMIESVVGRIAAGEDVLSNDQLMSAINASSELTKEAAHATIATAIEEYTAAAAHVLRDYPVDPQNVFDWVREREPALASRMIHSQMQGDFSQHHVAAKQYLETLPSHAKEAALGADLGPDAKAIEVNGNVMVEIHGKRYPWADALRMGGVI